MVIDDPVTMWTKLAWDIDNFSMIQRERPDLAEPLGFAAVNVCISAWSLKKWTWAFHAKRERALGLSPNEKHFDDRVHLAVPQQQMCEAIANTAKHASLREGGWPGGTVRINWHDPTEDDPGGYILQQVDGNGDVNLIALSTFGDMERNWLDLLKALGFDAPRHVYDVTFRQRWLRKLFGPAPEN